MQDRPHLIELLDVVSELLQGDVLPAVDGSVQFHIRVAINLLGIIHRELEQGDALLREEWEGVQQLIDTGADGEAHDSANLSDRVQRANETLCEAIRAGNYDSPQQRGPLMDHLRRVVDQKLAIANPKFLKRVTSS